MLGPKNDNVGPLWKSQICLNLPSTSFSATVGQKNIKTVRSYQKLWNLEKSIVCTMGQFLYRIFSDMPFLMPLEKWVCWWEKVQIFFSFRISFLICVDLSFRFFKKVVDYNYWLQN
jgi:hypothetical protein